jgi:hypothetical protein
MFRRNRLRRHGGGRLLTDLRLFEITTLCGEVSVLKTTGTIFAHKDPPNIRWERSSAPLRKLTN